MTDSEQQQIYAAKSLWNEHEKARKAYAKGEHGQFKRQAEAAGALNRWAIEGGWELIFQNIKEPNDEMPQVPRHTRIRADKR